MIDFMVSVALGWSDPAPSVRNEYTAKLLAVESNADAQFRLANWAKRQGLNEEADGHFRAAVHMDPQFAPAQKAIGRSLKSGVWETKDEHQRRLAESAKIAAERSDWKRRLNELGLESACATRPITDAAAAAIEEYASSDESRASSALKAFRQSNQGAATIGILRQAVASRFPQVRETAVAALVERSPDHYLPTLVDLLKPKRAGTTVVLGVGEIWHWQEGDKLFVATPASHSGDKGGSIDAEANGLQEKLAKRRTDAEFVRANAVAALTAATGLKLGNDYAPWRAAAMQITGSFIDAAPTRAKSISTTYYRPDTMVVGGMLLPTMMPGCLCCLSPGTPVATKRGVIPIDKVCIGELVLSKNIETGETAYKPVLARTLRPRIPMHKLTIGRETFFATAGHTFWVSEKGWVKAKELSKDASIGAETGVVKLNANDAAAESAQAYNLVVADFGTYFVGESRVLVHDNTPIRETGLNQR